MSALITHEGGETPIDFLELEWQNWLKLYLEFGYHKELGMTEEEYAASLPKFGPQIEGYKGRFGIPIIGEGRIAPRKLARLTGFKYPLNTEPVDWKEDPRGYITPPKAYVAWMQDGTKNLKIPVSVVRQNLAADERGATVFDGIALCVRYPEILDHHSIDLPGTTFYPHAAAYLSKDCGDPGLCLSLFERPNDNWGSATCGR